MDNEYFRARASAVLRHFSLSEKAQYFAVKIDAALRDGCDWKGLKNILDERPLASEVPGPVSWAFGMLVNVARGTLSKNPVFTKNAKTYNKWCSRYS